MSLKINEIFYSIQGESSWVGYPTVFVRTSGCNLRCRYCDTTYAYYQGDQRSIDSIVDEISSHGARHVCLTGGEPLLQPDSHALMKKLCDLGYKVSIETGGSLDCTSIDPRVKKIIDVKTPDSGAADSFHRANLPSNPDFSIVNSEFKFVICSQEDFFWAEKFAQENQLFEHTEVLYSPAHQRVDAKWLASKILSSKSPARLQTQLHKFIWSAHVRGV
ncbi:7-carboxy-7-deazaguanine synthase QueE [soil metagenome]